MLKERSLAEIARTIMIVDDVLACSIVDRNGGVLAHEPGTLLLSTDEKEVQGPIIAVIWGSVLRMMHQFGEARMVVVEYERAKVVGFPLKGRDLVVVVALPHSSDPYRVREVASALVSRRYGQVESRRHRVSWGRTLTSELRP